MKKKVIIPLILTATMLTSCGGSQPTPEKKEFENVFFDSVTIIYDGNAHSLGEVRGAPEGTSITYAGKEAKTDVGIYTATATLTKEGYNLKTLDATLTINPKDFTGLTYESKTVNYDGEDHYNAIELKGNLPTGTETTQKVTNSKGELVDKAINADVYSYTIEINKANYKSLTLTAKLTINPKEFTSLTYESKTVNYDGEDHFNAIKLEGNLPSDAKTTQTVTDSSGKVVNKCVNAGVYTYSIEVQATNYKTTTLNATLTILPKEFTGLTYESKTVNYDGKDHIQDINLVGVLPEGTLTNQKVMNSKGDYVLDCIEVDTYTFVMTLTNPNYKTLILNATLKINSVKKNMPVFASKNGSIYFSNGLDNSRLYSYQNNTISLVDYSSPKEFNRTDSDTAIYIAGSTLMNSVKEISDGKPQTLYSGSNIDDFVKVSNSSYYYSSNSLLGSAKSGIYNVSITSEEEEPVIAKVFEGKSDNLVWYNNALYFINGKNDDFIYKLDPETNNISLVLEQKTHGFIINNGILYCTVNDLVNDYIGYLDLAKGETKVTKLTDYAGEFLMVKNGCLYFNMIDWISTVKPELKGIWSINLTTKGKTHLITEPLINGFDVESSDVIDYINGEDLHLYRYTISTKSQVDLLAGFVPPEVTPLNTGNTMRYLNGKLYFMNMYADKTLYQYNELNQQKNQLTSDKVMDFFIHDNNLYFNQVTRITNNDLYSVSLKGDSEAVKLNTNDTRDMVTDGTYIYSVHHNFAGAAGGISRMKLDGSEYVKFSEVNGAKNLTIKDGKLYYINCSTVQDNGYIEWIDLSLITPKSEGLKGTILSKEIKNVKQFAFDEDNIFYTYNGLIDNSIRRTSFETLDEGTSIASYHTNPNEFIINGDYVYYYSYAQSATSEAGIYRVRKDATKDKTYELLLGYQEKYYASNLCMNDNGDLYFFNYIPKLTLGDSHIYRLNLSLSTKTVDKIA